MHMLDEESFVLKEGNMGTGSLMTSFVRALDAHQRKRQLLRAIQVNFSRSDLQIDRIFANKFVINFARHDTTANTLALSMLLLVPWSLVLGCRRSASNYRGSRP